MQRPMPALQTRVPPAKQKATPTSQLRPQAEAHNTAIQDGGGGPCAEVLNQAL